MAQQQINIPHDVGACYSTQCWECEQVAERILLGRNNNNGGGGNTYVYRSNCRLCDSFMENGIASKLMGLCPSCLRAAYSKMALLLIPDKSEIHCRMCASHIKYCQCPEKVALDNLAGKNGNI